MYEVSAAINNVHNKQIPLTPAFEIDFAALRASWLPNDKILFLCTPNNPSGNLLDQVTILEILESFQGMVVIDEAYVDFSGEPSWTALLTEYPNLIVLQTLSKAWGMAAIRVGVAMGHPWVISMMDRIKPPYNLSQPNQNWAYQALANVEKKNQYVAQILKERARLIGELGIMQSVKRIVPSDANFLLVAFDRAELLFDYLISEKVIIRNRTKQLHCQDCLRITVGKPEENTRLLELIQHFETKNSHLV